MAKICFYSISTELGGAERSLLEFLRYLNGQHQLEVLVPKGDGLLLTELSREKIPYSVLPMPIALLRSSRHGGSLLRSLPAVMLGLVSYLPALVRHFRATGADVIYTTGIKCHLLGGIASFFTEASLAWHLRDYFKPGGTRLALRILSCALPGLKIVANSQATRRSFSRRRPISVVYNGISPQDFSFSRSLQIRNELAIPVEKKIIGVVGVLARWKGHEAFLRMAEHILRSRNDVHFVVIGDQIYDTAGDQGYRSELKRLAGELGIRDNVSFLGFRRDNARSIQSLDILVHSSLRPEPFGRTIIEAMACGTPVTASAAGGPLEILEENSGLLHQPGNEAEMAANVLRLLSDSILYRNVRACARQRYLELFTHDQYNTELAKILGLQMPASVPAKLSATA